MFLVASTSIEENSSRWNSSAAASRTSQHQPSWRCSVSFSATVVRLTKERAKTVDTITSSSYPSSTRLFFGLADVFSSEVTKATRPALFPHLASSGSLVGVTRPSIDHILTGELGLSMTQRQPSYSRDYYGATQNVFNCNPYAQQRIP